MTPLEAMKLAISEGCKGAGFVSPNPLVGCVILDSDKKLLATGYHHRLGDNHAEVDALNAIADKSLLKGAHVFVTLEPCAHVGRTPSCARTLAELPLASVTFGLQDPNPLVQGKGVEILKNAGIEVHQFLDLQDELHDLCEHFLINMVQKRAFSALKVASSLDGRVALHSGESQWITGPSAREHVHYLRGCFDAVLVGVGTVLTDNPRLDSRHVRFQNLKPQRLVILDPQGHTDDFLQKAHIWQVRRPEDIFVVTNRGVQLRSPVKQIKFDNQGVIAPLELLSLLPDHGIHSVLVEGGPKTWSHFLRAHAVDRLYLFVAPKIIGEGQTWTDGVKIESLKEAEVLSQVRRQTFGEDLLISGRLNNSTKL